MKPKYCTKDFRTELLLQEEVLVTNPEMDGGQTAVWNNRAILWCAVKRSSGNERDINSQITTVKMYDVVTRFNPTITEKMRLLVGDKILNIRFVDDVELRHEFTKMTAEEGVGS